MKIIRFRITSLVPLRDGVVLCRSAELNRDICARLRKADDGRWEIYDLYLAPNERPLKTEDLRRIPLARIEAFANEPEVSEQLSMRDDTPTSLEEHAKTMPLSDAQFDKQVEFFSMMQKTRRRDAALRVPTKRPFPLYFYKRVATVYMDLAAEGPRPAAAIAEASGVPVTTVHSWIKECRKRELLPAGRPGKAG